MGEGHLSSYDAVIAGGGPAGAAAAWRMASAGARVLLIDKAAFPRDKPCGDGLTPRAVRAYEQIGLENELKRFHRVEYLRVHGAGRTLDFPWPSSDQFPSYGYVAARTELDELTLNHAAAAGAEIIQSAPVVGPIIEDGVTKGLTYKTGGVEYKVRADAVIAADGASSRVCRAVGMTRDLKRPVGIAVRTQFQSKRPDDSAMESYLEIRDELGNSLPGYGWVFPMGGGRINVGIGLLSTYKHWKEVNTANLLDALIKSLPPEWESPSLASLRAEGELKGWRLPMAFAVPQPWRPGILAVGDAAGVVNPFNGEGISEAVESGVAGAEAIMLGLQSSGVKDLSNYEARLDQLWGPYYRLGRTWAKLIGKPKLMRGAISLGMKMPPVMTFAFKVLSNTYHDEGGTIGDATMRGMLRLASVIRVG